MKAFPLEAFTATVLGRPRAWPRTATVVLDSGKRRGVNPREYRLWKTEAAAKLAAQAAYRTFTGEVVVEVVVRADRLEIVVVPLDPDDLRRSGVGLTGDLDNYAKAALDALQAGGVLHDDRQVVGLKARFRP